MSDDHDGRSENGAKPDSEAPPLYSRARTAPVIEGQAAEAPASAPPGTRAAEAPPPEDPQTKDAKASAGTGRKYSTLRPVFATAVVGALGVAGYYGWTEWVSHKNELTEWASHLTQQPEPVPVVALAPPPAAEIANTEENKTGESKTAEAPSESVMAPVAGPADEMAAGESTAPSFDSAPNKAAQPAGAIPKAEENKTEENKTAEAPSESAMTPVVEPADEKASAEAAAQAAPDQVAPKPPAVEAPAESIGAPVAKSASEKTLAETAARLAATQAVLEQVTARLRAVEGQLAAPKTDARALPSEREASASHVGNASARIVAAQSLLAAIRQGDDYAPMLAALDNLGGDPERLALLRAGLSAPGAQGLAKEFGALGPKILAAATPPAPPPQTKEPANFGETVLAFIESHAGKLVHIRPDGAPDGGDVANRVGKIEKDLARGDLAAAVAERAQLPAPALVVTAAWAAKAQAHIDAELAAKAELAAALQELSKSKS